MRFCFNLYLISNYPKPADKSFRKKVYPKSRHRNSKFKPLNSASMASIGLSILVLVTAFVGYFFLNLRKNRLKIRRLQQARIVSYCPRTLCMSDKDFRICPQDTASFGGISRRWQKLRKHSQPRRTMTTEYLLLPNPFRMVFSLSTHGPLVSLFLSSAHLSPLTHCKSTALRFSSRVMSMDH